MVEAGKGLVQRLRSLIHDFRGLVFHHFGKLVLVERVWLLVLPFELVKVKMVFLLLVIGLLSQTNRRLIFWELLNLAFSWFRPIFLSFSMTLNIIVASISISKCSCDRVGRSCVGHSQ